MQDTRIRGQGREGVKHDATIGAMRLLTPTRTQWTRNDLERDLLIQVAYSRRVSDAITQPILKIGRTRLVPSILFKLFTDLGSRPLTHVVEVDAGDGRLDRAGTEACRKWCAENDAAFHLIDAGTIRTDHLGNATLLTPYVGLWPTDADIGAVYDAVIEGGGVCSVGDALDAIVANGTAVEDAEHGVRQVVANWIFDCDVERPYGRSSPIRRLDRTSYRDSRKDPFLRLLQTGG